MEKAKSSKSLGSYFMGSFIWTGIGLVLAALLGYFETGLWTVALEFVFLAGVLSLLEVSISFDNAVVNAAVLKEMTPLWQRRFLTWGIFIAVFVMRLIFPLLIVCVAAGMGPIQALKLSLFSPKEYAHIMLSVHHEVAAFGGSFLALVALKFFFNVEKTDHWIGLIERPLAKMGRLEAIEIVIVLALLWIVSRTIPHYEALSVLQAGVAGVIVYVLVEAVGEVLKWTGQGNGSDNLHRASLGMFLYLEVLDASFSFDGVVGAFAITDHLLLIVIGLGIGAFFVRSLTIMMVDKGALEAFRYLEHGAFWAVASLASIMFLNIHFEIPEVVTGCFGAGLIGLSVFSSVKR